MILRLQNFSYRFAEQVLNSKLPLKQEIESVLTDPSIDIPSLSRRYFNKILKDLFVAKGWESQPPVFDEPGDPAAKLDFLKERLGIEVGFEHASTKNFQNKMEKEYNQKWEGSLNFEKVVRYLPHFKSAIQVPIYVIGVDL